MFTTLIKGKGETREINSSENLAVESCDRWKFSHGEKFQSFSQGYFKEGLLYSLKAKSSNVILFHLRFI